MIVEPLQAVKGSADKPGYAAMPTISFLLQCRSFGLHGKGNLDCRKPGENTLTSNKSQASFRKEARPLTDFKACQRFVTGHPNEHVIYSTSIVGFPGLVVKRREDHDIEQTISLEAKAKSYRNSMSQCRGSPWTSNSKFILPVAHKKPVQARPGPRQAPAKNRGSRTLQGAALGKPGHPWRPSPMRLPPRPGSALGCLTCILISLSL